MDGILDEGMMEEGVSIFAFFVLRLLRKDLSYILLIVALSSGCPFMCHVPAEVPRIIVEM